MCFLENVYFLSKKCGKIRIFINISSKKSCEWDRPQTLVLDLPQVAVGCGTNKHFSFFLYEIAGLLNKV